MESFRTSPGLTAVGDIMESFKPSPGLAAVGDIMESCRASPGLSAAGEILESFRPSSELYDANRIPELLGSPSLFPDLGIIQESFDLRSELPDGAVDHPNPVRIGSQRPPSVILQPTPEISLRFVSVPIVQSVESRAHDEQFDPIYWQTFSDFERWLRGVIEGALFELIGPNWIRQRVSQSMREEWRARQFEERALGRPALDAIQYAEFMDLCEIIIRRDNWRDVFRTIFQNRDDISVSFRRLNPVRRALAHSRPLSPMDILTLIAEISWIRARLGIRVLS